MRKHQGREGSVCLNEAGEFGLVTGAEYVDHPERTITEVNGVALAKPRKLPAGRERRAWVGVKLPGGGPWRAERLTVPTPDQIRALG